MAPKVHLVSAAKTESAAVEEATNEKIEKPHTLKRKYNSNEIIVNNKSSFKSLLVRCQKIIDSIHFDHLVIKSIGSATHRALNLAMQLNANNFYTFELEPRDYTVKLARHERPIIGADKDGFNPDAADRLRLVPIQARDIVVRKNRMEIDNLRKARSKDKERTFID